jgi:hypothetical protein
VTWWKVALAAALGVAMWTAAMRVVVRALPSVADRAHNAWACAVAPVDQVWIGEPK